MPCLHRLDIIAPDEDYPLAQALVSRHISFGWEEESLSTGETRIRVHCPQKSVLDELAECLRGLLPQTRLEREEVEECDWVAAWKEFFTPVTAGDFLVLPPWRTAEGENHPLPLLIEPKSAFGTGHHPTTTLCLEAISRLHREGMLHAGGRFLDLGTGTGILGIACAKLGLTGLGVDIDPVAVANAEENRQLNGIADQFSVREGSVEIVQGQCYDLVIANILAGPLRELAESIMPLVRDGGMLILSGFLALQRESLELAYAQLTPRLGTPFALTQISTVSDPTRVSTDARPSPQDEWVCLVWPGK